MAAMMEGLSQELTNQIPILNKMKAVRRLTVVERIYFESQSQDPTATEEGFEIPMESDEQPFSRRSKVGEEWMKLPLGWFTPPNDGNQPVKCSMMCLRNDGPDLPQGQLTEEWIKTRDDAVLELGIRVYISDTDSIIPISSLPLRRSLRMPPFDLESLWIRCRRGVTKFTMALFPA